MTSEITILRTQVNDMLTRGHVFAQLGKISDQVSETSSKHKGPNNVLMSKALSDVPHVSKYLKIGCSR